MGHFKYMKGKFLKIGITCVLFLIALTGFVAKASKYRSIEATDLNDFSNWRSGDYLYNTGEYVGNYIRICLNDYVSCEANKTYYNFVSDSNYHLLIREMDEDMKLIASHNMVDGSTFTTNKNTEYLAVGIYAVTGVPAYKAYKQLFENGFKVFIGTEKEADDALDTEDEDENVTDNATKGNVDSIDFADFSNWQSGCYYYADANYTINGERLCLNSYMEFQKNTYSVVLSDMNYHMLIRELNSNKQFIKSSNLQDGDSYTPDAKTKYLAIGIYNATQEYGNSYSKYESMFANGFCAKLVDDAVQEETEGTKEETEESKGKTLETIDYSDFSNWQIGCYDWMSGSYMTYPQRICIKDKLTFENEKYELSISSSEFSVLIRELDEDGKFLRSVTVANNNNYKPGDKTKYLALSIYNSGNEYGQNYAKYEKLFATGFTMKFTPKLKEETTQTPPKEYTSFREELKDMITSGDMTTHDISKYNLVFYDMYSVYKDLIYGECYVEYRAYINAEISSTRNSADIVQTVKMFNADEDYMERYKKMRASVDEALAMLDPNMTDMEKTLTLYNYVMEHTTYGEGVGAHFESGPLAYGIGVCQGYSAALELLLHEAGITSYHVSSTPMNHSWTMVVLDGELYHVDVTWDDASTSLGLNEYLYFIRNDKEFKTIGSKHTDWVNYTMDPTSTSEKYMDWFVHDVKGKMRYLDGYWYYADGNKLIKCKIDGNDKSVVAQERDAVTLKSIEDGVITYTVDGKDKSIK